MVGTGNEACSLWSCKCAANCLPFWPKKRSAKRHLSIVPGIFIENRQPKCQWVSWQQGWGGPVSSSTHRFSGRLERLATAERDALFSLRWGVPTVHAPKR